MLSIPSAARSNPRVLTGLIATTSLRLIDERDEPSKEIFQATLLRLLDRYRYDAFRYTKPRAILARGGRGQMEFRRDQTMGALVKGALVTAHKTISPRQTKEAFCDVIAADVKACFGSETPPSDLAARKARLRKFLQILRDRLTS